MNPLQNSSKPVSTQLVLVLVGASFLSSCLASIKPIYNAKEQAKAERAVEQLHRLRTEGRFDEIYALLDDAPRANLSKDQFTVVEKQAFEQWGKVERATLSEAKVLPNSPLQVRMIYNVKFEKGEGQEWIIWNIYGEEARLFVYQIKPGFDIPDSKQ
jgi:hypothetical protein